MAAYDVKIGDHVITHEFYDVRNCFGEDYGLFTGDYHPEFFEKQGIITEIEHTVPNRVKVHGYWWPNKFITKVNG